MRQPPVCSNGDAPTVSDPSSHRNIDLGSRYAATPAASGAAAPIITAERSPGTPNTARYAWTVLRNGAPAIPSTGGGIASNTPPPSSATANSSTFGTKNSVCAILQTTTQFRRKSGSWKHFRRANLRFRNLANNNVLVARRFLPDK